MDKFLKYVASFSKLLEDGVTKEDLSEFLQELPEEVFPSIGSYSGWGGTDLGAHNAGFFTMFAADNDKHAVQCFRLNHLTSPIYLADVTRLPVKEMLSMAQIPKGKEFIYITTPPCQGISAAGKVDPFHPLNKLLLNEPQVISKLGCAAFVLENVANLNKGKMRRLKAMFALEVNKWLDDYECYEMVMDSANYGVPQSRKRYILIGFRKDLNVVPSFPFPNEGITTIEDVLPELDGIRFGYFKKKFRDKGRPSPTLTKTENLWKQCQGIVSKLEEKEILTLCGYPSRWRTTGVRGKTFQRAGNSVMPPFAEAIFREVHKNLIEAGVEMCKTEELLKITSETVKTSREWKRHGTGIN